MTQDEIVRVEDALGYYEQHGLTRWFEGDMIWLLTSLLPEDSAYKSVEVKS